MIYKYLDFITEDHTLITESHDSEKGPIYWESQLNEILNEDWSEFSSARYSGDIFFIKFKTDDGGKYPYYSVLVEKKLYQDVYFMEDNVSEKFIKKFKTEFWKNAAKYAPEFKKFKPNCIGDWNQIAITNKFNL